MNENCRRRKNHIKIVYTHKLDCTYNSEIHPGFVRHIAGSVIFEIDFCSQKKNLVRASTTIYLIIVQPGWRGTMAAALRLEYLSYFLQFLPLYSMSSRAFSSICRCGFITNLHQRWWYWVEGEGTGKPPVFPRPDHAEFQQTTALPHPHSTFDN